MTEKLYEFDSYIKTFTAKVTECVPIKDKFRAVLDRTAFFPEGGGQGADTGKLGDAFVTDVKEQGGVIYHEISSFIEPGSEVEGTIDWEKRFYRMQNHSGEHILSGLLHKKYGVTNVGFHMGSEMVTFDTDIPVSAEALAEVEDEANEAVYKNVGVRAFIPTAAELANMELRSKIEITDGIRVVEIDGYDRCACCAPHVARTGEIGIIKIIGSYAYKGGTRVEILCGHDALNDYRTKMSYNSEIMKLLSAKTNQTVDAVARLLKTSGELKGEIAELKKKLALSKLEITKLSDVTVGYIKEADFDDMRVCANVLTSENDGVCAVFTENGGSTLYIASSEKSDISGFMDYMKNTLGARGGGKGNYSQGKIPLTFGDILEKLKNR